MLIRANKTTNEIDNSLIIPQLQGFETVEVLDGWEWIDLNSEWYIAYETAQIELENELSSIERILKAETLELPIEEMNRYLLEQIQIQNTIIDNLIIEVLNV